MKIASVGLLFPICLLGCDRPSSPVPVTSVPDAAPAPVVAFADPNLEACVREAAEIKSGDLDRAVLEMVQTLECPDRKIEKLDGIEALANLKSLSLWENQITSLEPIALLSHLISLQAGANQITDLSPLKNLTLLQRLGLQQNQIAELSPLASLADLQWLTLDNNKLDKSALAVLAQLQNLRWLTLEHNSISKTDIGKSLQKQGRHVYNGPFLTTDQTSLGSQPMISARPAQFASSSDRLLPKTLTRWQGDFENGPKRYLLKSALSESARDQLRPFVLPSPNQLDAGSCLYMANTGAMEILLNQHSDLDRVKSEGDTDLSERYLMNVGGHVSSKTIPYAFTDVIYSFNAAGGALLNRDYRFTMCEDADGQQSCQCNWDDELPTDWEKKLVATPTAERTLLFVNPNKQEGQFDVALFDDDVIDRIKFELRTKNAPVIVLYNHFLYWHSDIIVGYDDEQPTDCSFVTDSTDYYNQKMATSYTKIIEAKMKTSPCATQGVFYVRDSIYDGGSKDGKYDYGNHNTNKYSKRLIQLSYNWPRYLANHAYSIHRK